MAGKRAPSIEATAHVPVFRDDSAFRRVNREPALLLGGGRALLMQLAHPKVAAGVAEHSKFRGDPVGRFLRTLRPMYAITFGSPAQASAAADGIARRHASVVGQGYRADDPDLMLWVHATLVDSALTTYLRFVGPLSEASKEEYYGDANMVARLLGIPERFLPARLADFEAYVAQTVAGLEVSDTARALAEEIFDVRRCPLGPILLVGRELTAGLLPPTLCDQFGLAWGPRREAALQALARLTRTVVPRTPSRFRRPPSFLMPPRHGSARRRP